MFDLAIIGGGPAGVAAGVYASRKRLKTIFITESFGGQSTDSADIQNWIGTVSIPGTEFAKKLEEHLRAYAADTLTVKKDRAEKIEKDSEGFSITTKGGEKIEAKTVLITTGSTRRKLDILGAKEFENKGITYCASCDGPLFADKDVAVIGGGNAAFETAAQLLAYAKSVTLVHRSENYKADPVTIEKVLAHPNMKALKNSPPVSIQGDKFVTSLTYLDQASGKNVELPVEGIFVEIGLIPSTDLVKGLVELNEYNQIIVNSKNQRTKVAGLWAAGDCCDNLYHQNNIAAGDAVRALEDIYMYLRAGK